MVYDIVLETLSFSQKAKLLDPGTFGRFLWVMGTLKNHGGDPKFLYSIDGLQGRLHSRRLDVPGSGGGHENVHSNL